MATELTHRQHFLGPGAVLNSLNPHQNPVRWVVHYPQITGEETEAQAGSVTCPSSYSSLEELPSHWEKKVHTR